MPETNPYLHDIAKIISNEIHKPVSDLELSSKLEDFNLDSLSRVRVLVAFERCYGVDISEEQAARVREIGDLVKLLEPVRPEVAKTA